MPKLSKELKDRILLSYGSGFTREELYHLHGDAAGAWGIDHFKLILRQNGITQEAARKRYRKMRRQKTMQLALELRRPRFLARFFDSLRLSTLRFTSF